MARNIGDTGTGDHCQHRNYNLKLNFNQACPALCWDSEDWDSILCCQKVESVIAVSTQPNGSYFRVGTGEWLEKFSTQLSSFNRSKLKKTISYITSLSFSHCANFFTLDFCNIFRVLTYSTVSWYTLIINYLIFHSLLE